MERSFQQAAQANLPPLEPEMVANRTEVYETLRPQVAAVALRAMRAKSQARVLLAYLLAVAIAGCGAAVHRGWGTSGSSSVPLTFDQVKANLLKAGYRITTYAPNEGALEIDATHRADAGLSIDDSPDGSQLYAAVFETRDPAVRAAVISHNSDETTPFVRGELVFTISGTAPELQRIVRDAGDAPPSTVQAVPQTGMEIHAVRATLQRFIDVYAAGHQKAICASFTPQALKRSNTFCDPRSIFYRRNPDPRVTHYTIAAVRTSGNAATATIGFAGTTEQIALRKLGGRWKIDTALGAGHLF